MCDVYTTFQSLTKFVSGIGNAQTKAKGQGTVRIRMVVDDKTYQITLQDVLYIQSNPQSLISLE
jgi:uncharacterized protein (AIM24 family)